ncbi:MAG: gamma-glutamyl-gamma-aminobutyrate hydrolase family protein [Desulfobacterales bacterium]
MKPVIGVTGPDKGGDAAWWFTKLALFRAGGKAVRITPSKPVSINRLNGLIIGGGADVNPNLYGQEKIILAKEVMRKKRTYLYSIGRILFYPLVYFFRKLFSVKFLVRADDQRDDLEFRFIRKAFEKNMPILGICRGAQLINVYLGGSLFQDLSDFYAETPQFQTIFPKKKVFIKPSTNLAMVLKRNQLMVNALHYQAIHELGKGLLSAAVETNQVIQAIEYTSHPFVIGVQWHPEYLPQHKVHQNIFNALVQASRL